MRILVTGGAGFVGLHLLRELAARNAGDLFAATVGEMPFFHGEDDELAGVEWMEMDVTSDRSIADALGSVQPDLIYHLAGQASVRESFANPQATWEVNATGTLRLGMALNRLPAAHRRLLVISSAEVYGPVPEPDQPIAETNPPKPVTPYGVSKAAAELVSQWSGRDTGLEVVVSRSFNHIGPGQDERFFLPSMARQLARISRGEIEPVVRTGNLDITRDFLDVRDVVTAYVTLMTSGLGDRIYNVCSGVGRSLHAIVSRLLELSGTGARLEFDPNRARSVDIPVLVGDPAAIRALGWSPVIDLDDTLADMLSEAGRRA